MVEISLVSSVTAPSVEDAGAVGHVLPPRDAFGGLAEFLVDAVLTFLIGRDSIAERIADILDFRGQHFHIKSVPSDLEAEDLGGQVLEPEIHADIPDLI